MPGERLPSCRGRGRAARSPGATWLAHPTSALGTSQDADAAGAARASDAGAILGRFADSGLSEGIASGGPYAAGALRGLRAISRIAVEAHATRANDTPGGPASPIGYATAT